MNAKRIIIYCGLLCTVLILILKPLDRTNGNYCLVKNALWIRFKGNVWKRSGLDCSDCSANCYDWAARVLYFIAFIDNLSHISALNVAIC